MGEPWRRLSRCPWLQGSAHSKYRMLATKVYQQKNPEMLGDLSFIFAKYEGREEELYAQVCLKYGADEASLIENLPLGLEEDELVQGIVQLEEENRRRAQLLERKREEVRDLSLLIRTGSERRRCHTCDLAVCRMQRLARYLGELCWLVEEECRCSAEAEAEGMADMEDFHRGTQWLLKEMQALLPDAAREHASLADLARHLETTDLFVDPPATHQADDHVQEATSDGSATPHAEHLAEPDAASEPLGDGDKDVAQVGEPLNE